MMDEYELAVMLHRTLEYLKEHGNVSREKMIEFCVKVLKMRRMDAEVFIWEHQDDEQEFDNMMSRVGFEIVNEHMDMDKLKKCVTKKDAVGKKEPKEKPVGCFFEGQWVEFSVGEDNKEN